MIVLFGLALGVLLGLFLDVRIPDAYSLYVAVAILAAFDSVLGAWKAHLHKVFDSWVFITGFFGNSFIAVLLTFLGDKLGIPMYLAAVIFFGGRIFQNFATIRRRLLHHKIKGPHHEEV